MRANYIEDRLSQLIDLSSKSLLVDFIHLVKESYLTGRGDEEISPHSFLLSLTLAVYDCFTLGGSNAVPTNGQTKLQAIHGAEDNPIMSKKYSTRQVLSIPKEYFETIFYSIDKHFGEECFALYNSRRKLSCN